MERTTHPGFRQRQRQQMRMGRRARPRYENLNVLGGAAAMVIERAPAAAPEAEVGAANADNEPERNVQLPPTPPHPYESSFHDWIHREQDEYQRQLGSTRWNTEERSIYVHPFGPLQFNSSFMLKRIRAYIGWAVHGLVFEFLDGKRVGYVSEVESIEDERGTSMRHPTDWVDIEPGDYVRKVHGFNLPVFGYLCHTIHFEMASGRTISFVSKFQPWKDTPFAHELPDNALLHYVSFRRGKCIGMTAVESCMQMPIRSLQRVKTLLKPWQDKYHFLQLLSYRVDCDLLKNGSRPPGVDLWNKVINEFLPCSDLQDRVTHESNEEREEEE